MELSIYKKLIEKYYQGQTSIEEEGTLKSYLKAYTGDNEEILEAKILLETVGKEGEETFNLSFDELMSKKKVITFSKVRVRLAAVAAVLVIVLSLTFLLKSEREIVVYAYINGKPITDKAIALADTKKALNSISINLNKGTQSLNQLNKLNKPVELLTVKK